MKKIFIGLGEYGEYIECDVNEKNEIQGFNGFQLYDENQTYDGNMYLNQSSCSYEMTMKNGAVLRSRDIINVENFKIPENIKEIWEEAYKSDGFTCEKCGIFHDSNQYTDLSYVILHDCEIYCKECVTGKDLLNPLEMPEDIFKSKDMTNVKVLKKYKEIETLFCDSSGFGQAYEPALTKEQAIEKTKEIMKKYKNKNLYSGLTGIGQFQVYVTIWKK